ncbi:MAG: exodeoxyribonuclease VII small subunit [Pyrinomonadaceae bacterium]|nr:exodeoxyribonuclease VII small subunit [Phycisphaerales bacterium]
MQAPAHRLCHRTCGLAGDYRSLSASAATPPGTPVNTPSPRIPTDSPETSTQSVALTFEASLEQVEQIIERIEQGEVGLEDSLTQYEKGVELIRRCRSILKQAELRVEELTQRMQDADGPDNPG